mgnify:CR=1 FL=1
MLRIKVLGAHCFNCVWLEQTVREVLDEMTLSLPCELVHVTDAFEVASYGVLRLPALVINERVMCAGRLPTREQIAAWIRDAQETAARAAGT